MLARAAVLLSVALAGAVAFLGCEESPLTVYFENSEAPEPAPAEPSRFDVADTGTVTGRVTWCGVPPRVPPFLAPLSPLSEQPGGLAAEWPNPHAPAIDATTRGVGGAVVFLRGIDPARARPWDHPPVRVAVRDSQYHVAQGETEARTGFVRRGDGVTIVSEDRRFQAVQARGAAFFTVTLADPGVSCQRALTQSGLVELASNSGQFWARGYLFVADHPYLTRTDAAGRFSLQQVPTGRYELACWLPDWHEASRELDGETANVCRLTFRPAVVKLRDVTVERAAVRTADFTYASEDFAQ